MVMLQCTPPTGHVVTFQFQFLRVNKEKRIDCIYETKRHLYYTSVKLLCIKKYIISPTAVFV